MNKKRLSDLVRVLRGVPRKAFDMAVYRTERKCGTVCCAAGHYIEAYPRRSLRFDSSGMPEEGDRCGMGAIAFHFGMDRDDAAELFSPYIWGIPETPRQVARRFEKYMKTGQVPA